LFVLKTTFLLHQASKPVRFFFSIAHKNKFLFIIHRGDGWQIRPMLALWQKEVLS
jgi:hypothetical protein